MKAGDVTPVVRTPRGYQILQARVDRRTAQTMPFDQAREQISDRVFTDKRKARVPEVPREAARRRRSSSGRTQDVKKAYEEGLAEQAQGRSPPPRRPLALTATTVDPQWFAIWTRSRHEQVVREQLERKHIDAFLPTITRWSRWKDRKKKIDWPLFPGYCFARFDPADALPILKCTGVVNIVSFEGKPAPIPEYELDSIRLLVGSELQFDPCPHDPRRHDGRGRRTARCAASSGG